MSGDVLRDELGVIELDEHGNTIPLPDDTPQRGCKSLPDDTMAGALNRVYARLDRAWHKATTTYEIKAFDA